MLQLRPAYTPPIVARPRVRTGVERRLVDALEDDWQTWRPGTLSPVAVARRTLVDSNGGRHPAALRVLRDNYGEVDLPDSPGTAEKAYVELLREAGSGWSDERGELYCVPGLGPLCGDFIDAEYHKGPIGTVGDPKRRSTSVGASFSEEWSDDDLRNFAEITRKNNILDPAYLLKVMASESGLHPWAAYRVDSTGKATKDPSGYPYASGLIQLTKAANDHVGITEEERADVVNWSVAEQLPLVDRYYSRLPWTKAGHDYDSAAAVYFANFAGSRMMSRGTSPDTVIYSSGVDAPGVQYAEINDGEAYSRNSTFDHAKKGYITVQDLEDHLAVVEKNPTYVEALARLREVAGYPDVSSSTPWWKYVLGGLFVVGVGYAVAR